MVQRFRWVAYDLLWRWWGDDCVVYDANSAQTHQLDAIAGHVLMALRDTSGLTVEALFDALFAGDATEGEPAMLTDERAALSDVLVQLQALELLDSVPA